MSPKSQFQFFFSWNGLHPTFESRVKIKNKDYLWRIFDEENLNLTDANNEIED